MSERRAYVTCEVLHMLRSKGTGGICAAVIEHVVSNDVTSRVNDITGMDEHQQVDKRETRILEHVGTNLRVFHKKKRERHPNWVTFSKGLKIKREDIPV